MGYCLRKPSQIRWQLFSVIYSFFALFISSFLSLSYLYLVPALEQWMKWHFYFTDLLRRENNIACTHSYVIQINIYKLSLVMPLGCIDSHVKRISLSPTHGAYSVQETKETTYRCRLSWYRKAGANSQQEAVFQIEGVDFGLTNFQRKNYHVRNVTQAFGLHELLWTRYWTFCFHKI
jgi:hypothetical protein